VSYTKRVAETAAEVDWRRYNGTANPSIGEVLLGRAEEVSDQRLESSNNVLPGELSFNRKLHRAE
jgi:hypothetical protein